MSLHPVAAALRALATHLRAELPALTVAEGWPEADTEPELPELTLSRVGAPTYDLHAPAQVCYADGVATYRYGVLSFRVQLDLWTAYRVQRDEIAYTVETALSGVTPDRVGLWLTSTDYHDRPLSFDVAGSETMDDGTSAPDGLWRHRWALECTTDLVTTVAVPAATRVDLEVVTEQAGREITELRTILST